VTQPALSITSNKFSQEVTGHESAYCDVLYEVLVQKNGTTTWLPGSFITGFDTTSNALTYTITVNSTENSVYENYTIKVEAKVDPG
jgi:dTDP-4-dehydrorhamnose 3,5-epimerase-like enzyme